MLEYIYKFCRKDTESAAFESKLSIALLKHPYGGWTVTPTSIHTVRKALDQIANNSDWNLSWVDEGKQQIWITFCCCWKFQTKKKQNKKNLNNSNNSYSNQLMTTTESNKNTERD